MKKTLIAVLLIVAMLFTLTACGDSSIKDITTLVQGNIDAIYLGKASDEYLELIGSDKEEALEEYQSGLEVEAQYFCKYASIIDTDLGETYEDLPQATRQRLVNLFKRIYDKSKYEVSEAVKNGDEYTCKVVIYPIDIFEQLLDAITIGYAPYDDFNTKWEAKFSEIAAKSMTDEERTAAYESLYVDYNTEYADIIIGLAESLLPQLDYKEGKSISVQVQKGTDGFYRINDDDWKNIDGSMIYYP